MGVQRQSKQEYMARMQGRYLQASKREKGALLDEVVAVTGYHRRHAVRVLRHGRFPDRSWRRCRARPAAGGAGGAAGGRPGGRGCTRRWWWGRCGSRRRRAAGCAGHAWRPSCPSWCRRWRPRGSCGSRPADRAQLLAMSARTIDRRLRPFRLQRDPRNWHGLGTTKPGTLLKDQVPVRTSTPWEDQRPGFLEIDLVAHCGPTTEGFYLNTLVGTDVATGWTECVGVWGKSQRAVFAGVETSRRRGCRCACWAWTPTTARSSSTTTWCATAPRRSSPSPAAGPTGRTTRPTSSRRTGRSCAGSSATGATRARPPWPSSTASTSCSGSGPTSGSPRSSSSRRSATTATGKTRKKYDAAQTPYRRLLASGALDEAQRQALAETFAASGPAGPAPPVGRRRRAVGPPARTSERALRAGDRRERPEEGRLRPAAAAATGPPTPDFSHIEL